MVKLTAAAENARTLASALGLPEEEAAKLLDTSILVTSSPEEGAAAVGREIVAILSRTFADVREDGLPAPAVEVVIGATSARTSALTIWVANDGGAVRISRDRPGDTQFAPLHGALGVVVACYAASAAAAAAIPGLASAPKKLKLCFSDLSLPEGMWANPVELEDTYLAGAGAVGNGFLWVLRHFNVRGTLDIVDPDEVSSGNLNRQIWFGEKDIGKPKAERLVLNAQPFFPGLKLQAHEAELQQLKSGKNERWLRRLVVGVDSRRVRRHLQSELPQEVFDASTTGIEEVVLHFNRQPNELACLGCIYCETPRERAREVHVAEALGVSVDDVATGRIRGDAAVKIAERYGLDPASLDGMAYDSLFKELCGQKALMVEGQQVLAPFAFVSILAGALLALELVARLVDPKRQALFNDWRVSPWHPFLVRKWRLRGQNNKCKVCGDEHVMAVCRELWNGDHG